MTADEKVINAWTEWLEGDLWQQVHELGNQVHVFKSWREIVLAADEQSRKPGFFHQWVLHNYLDSLASGVRRLIDKDTRTNSLVRFLFEVEANAQVPTRDWWMSTAVPGDAEVWSRRFDELSNREDQIDPSIVREDRDAVLTAGAVIKSYLDTHIAHLDAERGKVEIPTVGDVHGAVDSIYAKYHKWFQIVARKSLAPLQPPRWEYIFTIQWIDTDEATRIDQQRREEWEVAMKALGFGQ